LYRGVADFVEEQQSSARELEGAGAGDSVGEGSAFCAEELAFCEKIGYSGAVSRDKGPFLSRREFMERPGRDLFAGPAFSDDEDGVV
jgi:hypothetical protein